MKDFNIVEYSNGCKFISGLPGTHDTNKKLAWIHDIKVSTEIVNVFQSKLQTETDSWRIETINSIIEIHKNIINKAKTKIC